MMRGNNIYFHNFKSSPDINIFELHDLKYKSLYSILFV